MYSAQEFSAYFPCAKMDEFDQENQSYVDEKFMSRKVCLFTFSTFTFNFI